MHLNSILMIGRVSAKGPTLRYGDTGTPACSFTLEIDEMAGEKLYTTFVPIEITGRFAEEAATTLESGDVVQISGRWKYRSAVDAKTGAKVSKPVVSTWGIAQRLPAARSHDAAAPESSAATNVAPEGEGEAAPVKARSRKQMYAGIR